MLEDQIIRWTARIAVGCYCARLILDASGSKSPRVLQWSRGWWTIGCGVFLVHVIAAFHLEYHWDHTVAFDYTAKRTAELTGWSSGVGIYINELFLAIWLVDTFLWWRNINWPQYRSAYWTVQFIFGFLMFQSTAVFGPPFWRPIVFAVVLSLIVLRIRSLYPTPNRP